MGASIPPLRQLAKSCVRAGATLCVLPLFLWYVLEGRLVGRDQALEGATELLSLIPGLPGRYLRAAFLRLAIAACHPSVSIGFGTIFSKADTRLGENVYIGPHCHIGLASIDRDVLVAAGVHLTSGRRMHGYADRSQPIRDQAGVYEMVCIGAGAWIGSAAIVMAAVGRDTIVGAGAVVTRPLPDGVIAVGTPARVIRSRDHLPPREEADGDTP